MISAEDRNRLLSVPAFRRGVWGLRIIAVVPLFLLAVVLVVAGIGPEAAVPVFAVAFVMTGVGVALVWSCLLPMEKVKKSVLATYGLDPIERYALMNGLFLRAAFRPGRTR